MGRKSLDRERPSRRSVSGGKRNRCIIFPANVCITAEALERRNQSWFARTNIPSDLIVRIGENNFHLHKLSMVSRSGYLNRLVFQRRGYEERDSGLNIHIENLPGGIETFELVVKFCYGLTFNLTAVNIAPLYCAAHFLEMIDDLEQGNLISKTEVFLSFVIFSSWKDTIRIFRSCETISSWAKELQLLNQCSESIAWKACTDPQAISIGDNEVLCFNYLTNNTKNSKNKVNTVAESWWFEDVSLLRIDHFVEVINAVKRKGMQSKLVGRCITQWAVKWLSQIHNYRDKVLRVTVESLLRIILPLEEGSISCNFLLHLLKAGLMMNIDLPLLTDLERIIARMLENCGAVDLMVQNYGNDDTVYDVSLVARVVEAYVAYASSNPTLRMFVVGRMVDEYLALVARDVKLSVKRFQLLAEALPENARYCDDHLYRAIDMYLKV
ncbi:hypothetical protein HHK36_026719 [Tetracentron sinense]|uniref:Uncharacterized protein n=1 Tax=Tetracentron sinense TaxID=13715 RepID=A0A835D2E8_TETSI|nr:hypothetical protein HHK36_026719 [Tetracentron sinense]